MGERIVSSERRIGHRRDREKRNSADFLPPTDGISKPASEPGTDRLSIALYVWRFLAPLPFLWRLHQVIRSLLSPFSKIIDRIPRTPEGQTRTLLDLGCGHGIFLALAHRVRPGLNLIGIDLDPLKIQQAKQVFTKAKIGGHNLAVMSIADFPDSSVDYIAILDVMYLVPLVLWAGILKKCYDSLKPGGLLLLKEMNTEKSGKLAILKLEENLAVNIFSLTKGEHPEFTFPPPEEICGLLRATGFEVEQTPLDRGYHVPHMLWIGHKPPDPDDRPLS